MQAKKRIRISYIFSIIVAILNVFVLILDWYEDIALIWKIFDVIYVLTAVACVIGFGIFNKKPIDFAIKNRKWFIALVCLACLSSLILGYITLITLLDINHVKVRKESASTIETTGEVLPTYEEIVKKIKDLDKQKEQNLITEEEYAKRKQEILNTLVNKNE